MRPVLYNSIMCLMRVLESILVISIIQLELDYLAKEKPSDSGPTCCFLTVYYSAQCYSLF